MLNYHGRSVLCLHVDDDVIVSGSEDETIRIYDRRAGKLRKTLQVEESYSYYKKFVVNLQAVRQVIQRTT